MMTGFSLVQDFAHIEFFPDRSKSARMLTANHATNLLPDLSRKNRRHIRGHHVAAQPQGDAGELLKERKEVRVKGGHVREDDGRGVAPSEEVFELKKNSDKK